MAMIWKKVAKTGLGFLQGVLPVKMFDAFYEKAFPMYKEIVRYLFLFKGLEYLIRGKEEERIMIKRIFNIMPYTLVGAQGLIVTHNIVKTVCENNTEGDIVELGVARGGCAALMASVMFEKDYSSSKVRRLWLFDSYEGLPEPTKMDFGTNHGEGTGNHVRPLPKGSCLGTIEEVKKIFFAKNCFPAERIEFIKGWFENTVPEALNRLDKIAVLRIDGDWYESTKCCLENLYDHVTSGGYIIIDDYQSCYGCKRAVDEYVQKMALHPDIRFDGRGGCYFKKE